VVKYVLTVFSLRRGFCTQGAAVASAGAILGRRKRQDRDGEGHVSAGGAPRQATRTCWSTETPSAVYRRTSRVTWRGGRGRVRTGVPGVTLQSRSQPRVPTPTHSVTVSPHFPIRWLSEALRIVPHRRLDDGTLCAEVSATFPPITQLRSRQPRDAFLLRIPQQRD